MGRRLLIVMIAVAAAGLFVSAAMLAMTRAAAPAPAPVMPRVPDFALTDQLGRPVDASVLDGRHTLMDFMFTACPLWCPGMTQAMHLVQTRTEGTGLRFLSLSIDGDHDTPERLAAWGADYGADPDRWTFATGDPERVWPLASALGFDVSVDQSATALREGSDDTRMLNHPTRLLLIGPDRRVLAMYDYRSDEELDALIQRARSLGTAP